MLRRAGSTGRDRVSGCCYVLRVRWMDGGRNEGKFGGTFEGGYAFSFFSALCGYIRVLLS